MYFNIIIFILFMTTSSIAIENNITQSQPQILFNYKKINTAQEKVALKIKFNNAVLYLEQEKYTKAIKLFKETEKLMKVQSWLNIGIAYYKLKSQNNAYLYLKRIYDVKEAARQAPYSYMSASYYLYKITKNRKFMDEIIKVSKLKINLNEPMKRLVVDVYIELKKYKKALALLEEMDYPPVLKRAMLYIKIKDYGKAMIYLTKALNLASNDDIKNKILWLKVYTDLRANNFAKLQDDISLIKKEKKDFQAHLQMPLKLYFNKSRFSHKQYLDKVIKFDQNRKIDFIFYFAPFIFANKDEVQFRIKQAFILREQKHIDNLNQMIEFNKTLIDNIKDDPIQRAYNLQKLIDKSYDTHSYEYYNLALCYAQIDEFNKAHKYFTKAYNLEKSNKLFASMSLISATRMNYKLSKNTKEKILVNLVSNDGVYNYYGQYIYKIIYDDEYVPLEDNLSKKHKSTIFFRSLYFLDRVDKKGVMSDEPLLLEFDQNPLVHLLKLISREKDETDYIYISRIQDTIPTIYNNFFVKGPMIITRYYIDILKAVAIFEHANLNIDMDTSATYYRTKALVQLYSNNAKSTVTLIEYLQKKYNMQDRYSYLLQAAAYIALGKPQEASLLLYEAKNFLKYDSDVEFLIGIKFLNEFKINSAMKYFTKNYEGALIDFKLVGFDKLLEEI